MQTEILRKIMLTGLADIMFDRYPGDNQTELPPEKKFYFMTDGETLMLPAANISSFLTAQNTESAPKRFFGKKYKSIAAALLSYTAISPIDIPFLSDGKSVKFSKFDNKKFYVHNGVARLAKGVPNPKNRPVMRLPWELAFEISIFPNKECTEEMLHDLFIRGGIAIGLGTFRGVFGKFTVSKWE